MFKFQLRVVFTYCLPVGVNEFRRDLGNDCIAVPAQSHNSRLTFLDKRGIDETFLVRTVGVTLKAHKSQEVG